MAGAFGEGDKPPAGRAVPPCSPSPRAAAAAPAFPAELPAPSPAPGAGAATGSGRTGSTATASSPAVLRDRTARRPPHASSPGAGTPSAQPGWLESRVRFLGPGIASRWVPGHALPLPHSGHPRPSAELSQTTGQGRQPPIFQDRGARRYQQTPGQAGWLQANVAEGLTSADPQRGDGGQPHAGPYRPPAPARRRGPPGFAGQTWPCSGRTACGTRPGGSRGAWQRPSPRPAGRGRWSGRGWRPARPCAPAATPASSLPAGTSLPPAGTGTQPGLRDGILQHWAGAQGCPTAAGHPHAARRPSPCPRPRPGLPRRAPPHPQDPQHRAPGDPTPPGPHLHHGILAMPLEDVQHLEAPDRTQRFT